MPAAARCDRAAMIARFLAVRAETEARCQPLSPEDCLLQSMPSASPAKWHLAHSTWFFETFVLEPSDGYEPYDPAFRYMFNSYYDAVGPRHPRPQRGVLSRPSLAEVKRYRAAIDERVVALLSEADDERLTKLESVVTLGLHHEQQHQELILTDILHALSQNPLRPAYGGSIGQPAEAAEAPRWLDFSSGVRWIGHEGAGFAFDNEGPRHRVWIEAFRLANRLTTNGEYLEFVEDRGYQRPEMWLSDGWAACQAHDWVAPFYWVLEQDIWSEFSLQGTAPLVLSEPVRHLSFFEADAFARWAGTRLATEAEWEVAAAEGIAQIDDWAWQWTASPYIAYPGYRPLAGTLGEYNAKFMSNTMVLRGGSLATPAGHSRLTYRNYFAPDARWQFAGIRLASDR